MEALLRAVDMMALLVEVEVEAMEALLKVEV